VSLPNETVIYYRQTDEFTKLPSQQIGLIVATLPQPLLVQWHRYQNISRYRIGDKIIPE
jgi:hypothetical protein